MKRIFERRTCIRSSFRTVLSAVRGARSKQHIAMQGLCKTSEIEDCSGDNDSDKGDQISLSDHRLFTLQKYFLDN